MELEDATIIYLAFILPILLILSFSLSVSIKEIRATNDYQNKLIDATRDGIQAFEINTSNETFRDVSDALKIMVEASINTFKEGFAKRIGMSGASKATIDNYLPFTLFTLNDGYYINSPSFTPHVLKFQKDGIAAHVGDYGVSEPEQGNLKEYTVKNSEYENMKYPKRDENTQNYQTAPQHLIAPIYNPVLYQKYNENEDPKNKESLHATIDPTNSELIFDRTTVLKNYIPYSARYKHGEELDVVISYSMDNFLSVIGKSKTQQGDYEYFSRSGYLLDPGIEMKITGIKGLENGDNAGVTDEIIDKIINYSNNKIEVNLHGIKRWYINPENGEEKTEELDTVITYNNSQGLNLDSLNTTHAYMIQQREAVKYYIKSYYFTKWAFEKLKDIEVRDVKVDLPEELKKALQKTDKNSIINDIKTEKEGQKIFDSTDKYVISDKNSYFNYHKKSVMRNSIQYNIFIAASNFSKVIQQTNTNKNIYRRVEIPMLSDVDWEDVCTNISMVTFTNGLKTPKGILSTYAKVSSGDNQFTINEDGLYFVAANAFDKGDKPDLKIEDYKNNPLYKYHKITSTELDKLDQNENVTGYVGDLINNFIYDGKVLTAAEKNSLGSDGHKANGSKEFLRKNYKSFRSVVEDNAYKEENVKLKTKAKRLNALYSTIGAKKNTRVNLISIKENRSFKLFKLQQTFDSYSGDLKSASGKYTPTINDIQIVVKLPEITEVKRNILGTMENPRVLYDFEVKIGDFKYEVNNKALAPKGKSQNQDKKDIEYENISMMNILRKIPLQNNQKIENFFNMNDTHYFGLGQNFEINLKNIRLDVPNAASPQLEIVEVRVNYN